MNTTASLLAYALLPFAVSQQYDISLDLREVNKYIVHSRVVRIYCSVEQLCIMRAMRKLLTSNDLTSIEEDDEHGEIHESKERTNRAAYCCRWLEDNEHRYV